MAAPSNSDSASRFARFADDYLRSSLEFMPPLGSSLGLHEYDGRTPDLSKAAIARRVAEIEAALDELGSIDPGGLDLETRFDYDLLRQGISADLFKYGEQHEHTYFPMLAMFLSDVTGYVKRDYAPAEERARKLIDYERGIPKLIEQAQALLEPPLSKPLLKTAIEMSNGQASYMQNNLPETVGQQVQDEKLLEEFAEANRQAVDAIEGYIGFLKEQQEHAKEDFAIGAHMFERMLAVNELVDLPIERVLEVGRANLEANKEAFIQTARQIDPNKDVRAVADMVSGDHPTAAGLVGDAEAMLEEIRQYLIDKDIITVPSEVRCKVAETPEFLRWGFAFMDAPGPFEKKATEAFYYVTPVDKSWTPEQAEEWLRRFNYGTLRDVSVHEAYPGHYVHFLHTARVTSPVRKAFGSYSFVEGWAHYCEQMMVEEGYRGENPLLRFAQLSEALLRNTRYVVSIMMHTGRMTLDEATRFMMENAFMEELPARKEATRGTFDPGYLNYTLGKLLLLKLRDDVKAREGDGFSLKSFHDRVLALGYPPVPLVRRHLLGEDNADIL